MPNSNFVINYERKRQVKNSLIPAMVLTVLLTSLPFITSCKESDNADNRRARLVANENIELKKKLELKDKEIQKQKNLLAKCEEDKVKEAEQVSVSLIKLMQQLGIIGEENQQLNTKIKELEEKIAADSNQQ
jgi:hypothetical protein